MKKWIEVGTVEELKKNGHMTIYIHSDRVAVFFAQGEYFAMEDVCTHAEASLSEGEVEGQTVICPLHGSRFDLRTGTALSLPAVSSVRTFPVKVEKGRVYVAVEE